MKYPILGLITFTLLLLTFICCKSTDQDKSIDHCNPESRIISIFARDNLSKSTALEIKTFVDSMSKLVVMKDSVCTFAWVSIHSCLSHYHTLKTEYDKAIIHADSSLYYGKLAKDELSVKNAWRRKSLIYKMQNKLEDAIVCLQECEKIPCISIKKFCNESKVQTHVKFASYYSILEKFPLAEKHLLLADSIQANYNNTYADSTLYTVININLGELYNNLGLYTEAIKYNSKGIKYCPSKAKMYKAAASINLAMLFTEISEIDSAHFYFKKAISLEPPSAYQPYISMGLGDIKLKEKKFVEAKAFFETAKAQFKKTKSQELELESLFKLAETYNLLKKQKLFNNSFLEINRMVEDYEIDNQKYKDDILKLKIFKELSDIGNYSLPKKINNLLDIRDSVYRNDKFNQVESIANKFNVRQLQDSVQIYQLESANQSLQVKNHRRGIYLLSLIGFALLFGVFKLWQNFKLKQEENTVLQLSNEELKSYNESLQHKVNQMDNSLESEQPIPIQSINKTIYLKPSEIQYIKAEYNGVRIYLEDKNYWSNASLKTTLVKLKDHSFFQIHRSTVVNVRYVQMVNSTYLKLTDGSDHNIGRAYKKQLKDGLREEE